MAACLRSVFRGAFLPTRLAVSTRAMSEWGDGAGKGGGSGGSIRDAGGSFGKMEAAREEEFFRKKQKNQLKKLKDDMCDEIEHHDDQIRMHKDAIERHKKKIRHLEHED